MRVSALAEHAGRLVAEVTASVVERIEHIEAGVMTFKFAVNCGAQQYIVRFYPPQRSAVVRYEPEVIARCLREGMRVPEVIADSRAGPRAPLEYLLYRKVPGTAMSARLTLLTEDALAQVCRALVQELGLLSRIHTTGYGDLRDGHHGSSPTWLDFAAEGFRQALAQDPIAPSLDPEVRVIAAHLDRFDTVDAPAYAWGDISPDNVILDAEDRIAGLVDFEGMLGADPALNLGYLRARYAGTRFHAAFERAWPALDAEASARSALYVVLRAMRLSRYSREPMPTGEERLPVMRFLPGLPEAVAEASRWVAAR